MPEIKFYVRQKKNNGRECGFSSVRFRGRIVTKHLLQGTFVSTRPLSRLYRGVSFCAQTSAHRISGKFFTRISSTTHIGVYYYNISCVYTRITIPGFPRGYECAKTSFDRVAPPPPPEELLSICSSGRPTRCLHTSLINHQFDT